MSAASALDRLSALAGIGAEYIDAWGQRQVVGSDIKRRLLRAMGFPADSEAEAARSCAKLERQLHGTLTPPVVTLSAMAEAPAIQVTAPKLEATSRQLAWTIELEDGRHLAGSADWAALSPAEEVICDGERLERRRLPLPSGLPTGYHDMRLCLSGPPRDDDGKTRLIVTPATCYVPSSLAGEERRWGFTAQLYGLRSRRNWGIGDFSDLATTVRGTARLGGATLGLNPLHALFPERPTHASPYSPSDRLFLNILYLDVEAIEDFKDSEPAHRLVNSADFQRRLQELRDSKLVDYAGVAACKLPVLELLYRSFRESCLGDAGHQRTKAFREYQERGGRALHNFTLFQVLAERVGAPAGAYDWRDWPEAYRNPHSEACRQFAAQNQERLEFHQYLQWQAEGQLLRVSEVARRVGMSIGLYHDLAVGADGIGAEAWDRQDSLIWDVHVGAPPDALNLKGQNWGLRPLNPIKLRDSAFAPFIELLRANMRRGGALRIDHILGLMRLYLIPAGVPPGDGAYVTFPWREMIDILALESQRSECLVIGEDLGTVPSGLREALAQSKILSYRLFYFERNAEGHFLPTEDYPGQALVSIGTHDLPTFPAFWSSRDIQIRDELGLWPTPEHRKNEIEAREKARREILALFHSPDMPADEKGVGASDIGVHDRDVEQRLVENIYAALAKTPSRLLIAQFEDLIGQQEQVNVPGTIDEHPNWRQKLPLRLSELFSDLRICRVARDLAKARGESYRALMQQESEARRPINLAIPSATYRVQFTNAFTFDDAARIIPYLSALGISHLYASPWLRARAESSHGYDITDHNAFNPELGGAGAFENLAAILGDRKMGHILDFVPNHMGIGKDGNEWWLDVLEWGEASPYADYFDIDWNSENAHLRHKVLLPILGDHYGRILEAGELIPRFDPSSGRYSVWYHEHRFPIDPRDYELLLQEALDDPANESLSVAPSAFDELRTQAKNFAALGERRSRPPRADLRKRARALQAQLAELALSDPAAADWLAHAAARLSGEPGKPESFQPLHHLLERQNYRLAYWGVAAEEINYRRFFNINELAGIRVEDEELFQATHRLVERLIQDGKLQGLRIDHIDGLADPEEYCRRLQSLARDAGWASGPFYVVIEKILARHERLHEAWPVAGTTGYDFITQLNGLLVDMRHEAVMTRIYHRFIGRDADYDDLAYDSRHVVMRTLLGSELSVLARDLHQISQQHWRTRDYTLEGLRIALREIAACFPVYRTYVTSHGASSEDRRDIAWAVSQARKRWRGPGRDILDFVEAALTTDLAQERESGYGRSEVVRFAMKFQQYTGPVAAKGIEDTAFYRFARLVSLNEVGGDPRQFGISPSAFHHMNQERMRSWPHGMLATSTHDAKRGEDMRARLDVLSELPSEWAQRVTRWVSLNRRKKQEVDGRPAPSRNDEYLLYQTLVGAWPNELAQESLLAGGLREFGERIEAYMQKAVREAKDRTSWEYPNQDYEAVLENFIERILDPKTSAPFLNDFLPFQARIARIGMLGSLVQAVLKLTSPGHPDFYQGSELWDLSLVDPDNRRPVDFDLRARFLAECRNERASSDPPGFVRELRERWRDGRIKLYVISKLLQLRRELPGIFEQGAYIPLDAVGPSASQVVAFSRIGEGPDVLVAVGRHFASLLSAEETLPKPEMWGGTCVKLREGSPNGFRDVLIGREHMGADGLIPASMLFEVLPVAVLVARP